MLEHAQARTTVIASPFYQTMLNPSTALFAKDVDEWGRSIDLALRQTKIPYGQQLQNKITTRYNSDRGAVYTGMALKNMYATIIGKFREAIAA